MKQTTHPIRHHASADAYELHLFGSWRNAQYARGMVWRAVNIPEPQSASGKDDQISRKMRKVVRCTHYTARLRFPLFPSKKTSQPIAWLLLCSTKLSTTTSSKKLGCCFFRKKKSAWSNHPMKMRGFFRPHLLFTQVAHWLRPHMRNTCLPHPWSDPIRRHNADHSRCLGGKFPKWWSFEKWKPPNGLENHECKTNIS